MDWLTTGNRQGCCRRDWCRLILDGRKTLVDPRFDQDSCGVGFVASVDAVATHHDSEAGGGTALARLAHRGAVAADGKSSDGVGVMTAVPAAYLLECMWA